MNKKNKRAYRDSILSFIKNKQKETIKEYIVAFHSDENIKNPLGCIRVDSDIQDYFGLTNGQTYDIYFKLKSSLSEDTFTRLVLAKISNENYLCEN